MERAVSSSLERVPRRVRAWLLCGAAAAATLNLWSLVPATGQPAPAGAPPAQTAKTPEKLVIDADELVYDKDKNTVSAIGSVQLFYQGRVLQADRVIYDRNTKRLCGRPREDDG
jgi:lipopolysaccharide assembly outer membrane protein LptD (OstA)